MIFAEKQRLRAQMRRRAASFSTHGGDSASLKMLSRIISLSRPDAIFLYSPIAGETDPLPIMEMHGDLSFLFPKITGDHLEVYRMSSGGSWISGPFGILEPDPGSWEAVSPADIDLAVVPGLAFDHAGGRLGRGKGFYDRLLGDPAFRGIKVGLASEWQIIEEVPCEVNDIRMDLVVCGEKIHDPGSMLDKLEERG